MKPVKNRFWSLLLLCILLITASRVAGQKNVLPDSLPKNSAPMMPMKGMSHQSMHMSMSYMKTHCTGTLADFPKLHPMIVHFPIVFLLLALITQLFSFFIIQKELSGITLVLVFLGFVGAYLASTIYHGGDPDLSMLDPISKANFLRHEQFAHYTVWISGIALVAKTLSQFLFKRKIWAELLVTALLIGSAYTIVITGDMGARLVYINGIGVQGNELPAHDNM
ncbi:MAG: DUF2231 domain-containing protein [Chitinophagaceae bacterium]